ncbi:hypothetical protein BU24DRAFT_43552 [Aaosphaeria arxii CBS 175.79]|uniref:SnoaL-like domain-containing protein n=1 Tax=Aaosphaeria arxii CBS 175.79 TaxID=1450172 RepID=A0A6A5Y9U7_9PLEO|nr:uncharacterized protein BU24DRAFT_43552 [Aaosphaeria arxii CBS 175.79]KAF2022352.1 hypothetical protein BU24DRAFT_43552 [Aaosphaeria arxii CBS 175.79]
MPSKQRQTANKLVEAFNALDVPTILSLRTPNCLRTILPSSLNQPSSNNEAYLAQLNLMKTVFRSFQVTVNDVIEGISDTDGRVKIIMYVSARGETPAGEYRNEYVWKMGFDEDGEKISEWSEYVDANMARNFYPKLMEVVKRQREEDVENLEQKGGDVN